MFNDQWTLNIDHSTLDIVQGRWRRPTLPRPLDRSTIGADRLNDRVRDGNGCGPVALVASNSKVVVSLWWVVSVLTDPGPPTTGHSDEERCVVQRNHTIGSSGEIKP